MKHPKASNINITITPSSRPSTIGEPSSPRSYSAGSGGRGKQEGGGGGTSSSKISTSTAPPQQYSLESSPTSSSSSSFNDHNDYAKSSNQATGRHVQGLPASALATVDAVLHQTRNHDIDDDNDGFDAVDSGNTDNDESSKIDQMRGRDVVGTVGGGGGVIRDHPLGQESKISKTQCERHIRLADPLAMTNKGSSPHRRSFQDSSLSAKPSTEEEDNGETDVDRRSLGSRGQGGGHFYNYENDHVLSQLQPTQYQREFYERQQQSQQQQRQQQMDKQDQILEMYRTKSFMSELSFERGDNGGGSGDGDGYGETEKQIQYYAKLNFQQDPEMERRIVKKLDRHLLPLLGILYLFSYLDRVNIGNARLFGLEEAVHLSDGQYNIALASFFLAYCLFELPSNWMLVRLGPRTWIPLLMFLWGGVSLALAWVTSFTGIIAARFALGTAEAGFVPGVLFYLTLFYKRSEHSFRMAVFLCFNILAGAFGGLLAAGISHLDGTWGLQGWQWIFILEAIPTILLAILTWFIMTPSPMEAKFLTAEERIYATNRIIVDNDIPSASWRQTRSALTDVRVYLICLLAMFLHIPGSGVVLFLPSLIADMGFKATTAQLLTVPAYLIAACVALLIPWWSDRRGVRGYFVIFVPMLAVVGFSLLALAPWTWLRYLAVTFALCGMLPTSVVVTSWLTNNTIGHAKRATALAMVVSASSLASMVGTQVYRHDDAPRYRKVHNRGHSIMAISICCVILTAVLLRTILSRENHRRENNQTKGLRLIQFMSEAHLNDLGDMHPNFRYTL
ncbi:hypothetical protein BGX29_002010 [Mortierella sp. GBA35]|nr:hypothetical protein BGX29_002010 [Mortierella sp. GBA35]